MRRGRIVANVPAVPGSGVSEGCLGSFAQRPQCKNYEIPWLPLW
ncbi:hypothetical protein CSB93_4572 [Pseudomonas paraeruginosa]|uniref:Uncharacterized protein n=1 Tax=Pseudomonas paraeruginosa TaxID=2994495 RepID=A0A2R3J449_9PSED|nr:hypothetical protein CSB93_4572 [Pseudomonas paraeruginosa]AWE94183.1 hypothetical protein CSC28_3361 [Pseudomonas paraeruginosa]PTC36334.1 hypothetical protein CLJ1_3193 [Pseudomonas aeruginosa]